MQLVIKRALPVLFVSVFFFVLTGTNSVFAQACEVQTLRIGGEPGDLYIGPTCNADDTHRTCFYVSGVNLPEPAGAYYEIDLNGVSYPVAFESRISDTEAVACVTDVPYAEGYDVEVRVADGCGLLAVDLYDAPDCSCTIDTIRLGGEPGDTYVGPTCNADGSYRSCYYIEGDRLPEPVDPYYQLELNGEVTAVAFEDQISSNQAVACATGLSPYEGPVDVLARLSASCESLAPALYDSTGQCTCLTDPDEAAACAAGEVLLSVEKTVVNDSGGTLQVADFPLFVGATPVISGEQNAFPAGVYTVSETGDPGYAVTYGGDCAPDGTIDLQPGPPRSCTVTNDDIAPTLTVVKSVVPDDDGGRFTLWISDDGGIVESLDDAGDGDQLGPVALEPGAYVVGEDGYGGTSLEDYVTAISGDCADDGAITLALGENRTCTIQNGRSGARFRVTKQFSDDNPATVTVQLTCQTGLPLVQTFDVSESGQVNFVVTNFTAGELNCRIQEIGGGATGYSTHYSADVDYGQAGAMRSEADGCYFDEILFGQFVCSLDNQLEPVDLAIEHEWSGVDESSDFYLAIRADYSCHNVREGPSAAATTVAGSVVLEGAVDSAIVPGLYPHWDGSSYCTVTASAESSGAEVDDSDCANLPLAPDDGNGCTIVTTVFFEGIPTSSPWGLALLAVLLFGAGAITLRRLI